MSFKLFLKHNKLKEDAEKAVDDFVSLGYMKEQILHRIRYPDILDGISPSRNESNTFWDYSKTEKTKEVRQFFKYMKEKLQQLRIKT